MAKCRDSQELIFTQISWASVGAEQSRNERERNANGIGRTKSQPELQFSTPPTRDYHDSDANIYNVEGGEQTVEEELLGALLDANEALLGALRMYDDVMRVVEEQVAVEISKRDVKMDRRVSVIHCFLPIHFILFYFSLSCFIFFLRISLTDTDP